MGRPLGSTEYSDEVIIAALEKHSGLITLAAKYLKCSPDTIRNRAKTSESIKVVLEDEREKIVDLAEQKLIQAIKAKEAWAIALVLKTLGKSRGYVERQEVTGSDGNEMTIKIVYEQRDNAGASKLHGS